MWESWLYAALIVVGLVILDRVFPPGGRGVSRFPGPKPYPIVGNVIPPKRIWVQLAALSRKHGPIFSLRIFRTPMLVINNVAVAREILDNKSGTYWSRPFPKMIELAGMVRGVLFEPDAGRLRQARKMLNLILHPRQLENFHSVVEHHVMKFLGNLLRTPEDFIQHLRSVPAGITLEVAYGYKVQGNHDPWVEMADVTVQNFARANTIGARPVDFFPFLANFPTFLPGMGFKREALSWRDQYTELAERGYHRVQDEIKKGIATPSLVSKVIMGSEEYPEDLLMYTAAQVVTGGADTSVSSLMTFFLTMTMHQDIQRKAHAEIDRVIGRDRLPQYDDRANLPYTQAILTEMVRCFPSVAMVTRSPSKEDIHDGFHVAKNTFIIVNIWAMLHDETVFPEPEVFNPERWLSKDADSMPSPWDIAFGFGRRVCPGRHLGEEFLFMTVACTLATFDILPVRGADGEFIMPSGEYTDGGITFPVPFKCDIRPRSKHAEELIAQALNMD